MRLEQGDRLGHIKSNVLKSRFTEANLSSKRNQPRLWHPDVPGPLWNGTKRVARNQIRAYCEVLAREFHPEQIILFGSYATGTATADSDVDILVVMPFHGSATKQVVQIRNRAEAPFPMDLLVWKPQRLHQQDSFTQAVIKEGRVMYEARHS
jgi:predicted nucleotidyltransferase